MIQIQVTKNQWFVFLFIQYIYSFCDTFADVLIILKNIYR